MRNDEYRRRSSTILDKSNTDTVDSNPAACMDTCLPLTVPHPACAANLTLAATGPKVPAFNFHIHGSLTDVVSSSSCIASKRRVVTQ